MSKRSTLQVSFRARDVVEIALGACILAFPTATTEEVWDLGAELSLSRAMLFLVASVFFLAVLIYGMHGHKSRQAVRQCHDGLRTGRSAQPESAGEPSARHCAGRQALLGPVYSRGDLWRACRNQRELLAA